MATKQGTTVKAALDRYTGMENKIRADMLGGLDEIVSNASNGKLSLRDVAAHIMGQTPEQNQSQSDATIRELKQTVARLEQQVGGVTQTITQQRENATLQEVTKFAEAHPRFEELAEDIGFFMQSGRAKDLSEAYTLAERLNPAPVQATAEVPKAADASAKVTDLAEQIRKGAKSPTGAPSAGSDPATNKRPSKTIRGSLDRAFQQAGL
jgi:TolA-binding protein